MTTSSLSATLTEGFSVIRTADLDSPGGKIINYRGRSGADPTLRFGLQGFTKRASDGKIYAWYGQRPRRGFHEDHRLQQRPRLHPRHLWLQPEVPVRDGRVGEFLDRHGKPGREWREQRGKRPVPDRRRFLGKDDRAGRRDLECLQGLRRDDLDCEQQGHLQTGCRRQPDARLQQRNQQPHPIRRTGDRTRRRDLCRHEELFSLFSRIGEPVLRTLPMERDNVCQGLRRAHRQPPLPPCVCLRREPLHQDRRRRDVPVQRGLRRRELRGRHRQPDGKPGDCRRRQRPGLRRQHERHLRLQLGGKRADNKAADLQHRAGPDLGPGLVAVRGCKRPGLHRLRGVRVQPLQWLHLPGLQPAQ